MKKLLLSLKQLFTGNSMFMRTAFMLFLLIGLGNKSYSQIYYVLNDGAAAANDKYMVAPYAGGTPTTIYTGQVVGAIEFAIDGNNNRLFAVEANSTTGVLKVVNLTTGALIRTITSPQMMRGVKYDAASDYIYYSTGGSGTTANSELAADDAIYRIHPDGTGLETVATSICENVYKFTLDLTHNQIIVYQSNYAKRQIITINVSNPASPVISKRSFATSYVYVYDVAYNPNTGYLYYIVEGNNGAATTAGDFLGRQKLDGTENTQLITNFLNYPGSMVGDWGNNRIFVNDALRAQAKIVSVDLSNNTFSTVPINLEGSSGYDLQTMAVPDPPSVTTSSASSVSSTSATLGGNLVFGYGLSTERGVVYSSTNSTPTVSDSKASMVTNTSNGAYSASVTGLSPVTTYYARAYAKNGAGTSYGTVTTFTTTSNDASLSGFTLSQGTLNPSFSANTTSYTASVANATTSITVTPTRNQGSASIKVNGAAVTSGSASGSIALNVGSNVITTVVTAQDGSTTKTYTLTVTRAQNSQTITFNTLPAKAYGDADFAPGATSSAGLTVSYSSDNTAVATIVNNQVHVVGVGTANITASQAGDASTLAANNVVQSLTVSPKTITVTATAQTKVYGNTDPALTYTATGVVGSDAPTGALSRVSGTNVGSYAIQQGTLSYGSNYNISYVSANLVITKRPLTIAPQPVTKVYGQQDFANGAPYALNGTTLAPGDFMTGLFGRDNPSQNVGVYTLTLGQKRPVTGIGEDLSSNYNITFVPNTFTITAKSLAINAYAQTKTFGDADPALTYVTNGLEGSDAVTGTLSRVAGENVGVYAISQGSLTAGNNYTITYSGANLTIGAKTINVSANAQTKGYGDADPTLTYTADALVNGDTFSGTLSRDAGEALGNYAIKQGTLALGSNYNIAFNGSSLTIGAKNITVIADAKTKVYGDNDPALTYTTDVPLAAGNSFTGSLTRDDGKNVGDYAITQGTLALNSNYNVTFTSANLTITKRPLGIAPVPRSKVYGDANPNFPYQITGTLAPNEGMTGQFAIEGGNNVGEHAILLGGKNPVNISTAGSTINNYNITFTPGVFTITAKPVTVTADAKTKEFGTADPALTYTTNVPLVSGDAFTGELTRTAGEDVGTYPINQGTLALSTNYSLTYAGADLTITPSTNANLSALVFDGVNVTPAFSSDVTSYAAEVDPYFFQVAVTPTAAQANAQISVNGTSVPSGQTQYIPLYSGPNTISTVVTAQDGTTTKTYSAVVTKKLDTDATLAGLFFFNGGTSLSPDFDPNVHNYTMDVPNSTVSARIVPYPNSIFASVEVNGTPYNGYLNPYLQPGSNVFTFKVIAEESSISETYTLTINRALSSNNLLSSLSLTNATISPVFNANTLNYTASVDNGTYSAAIQAYPADTTARYKVNGVSPNMPWESVPVDFNTGDNNFNIDVIAQNGDVKQYKLVVTRALSSNSSLSNLTVSNGTLSPYFEGQTGPFSLTVPFTLSAISVTPTVQDAYASVTVNGAPVVSGSPSQEIALNYGSNNINVVVTAQNGATTAYSINVTRPAPSNDAVLALKIKPASTLVAVNGSANANYTTSVDAGVSTLLLTTTARQADATITVDGVPVTSGSEVPVALNAESTVVNIVGTAQDGVTKRTYSITVKRTGSSNTSLALKLTPAANLVAVTGPNSSNYSTSVDAATSSITITPTAQDANAVVRLNGNIVASGVASAPIPLNAGATVINLSVTAADGKTVKTYGVTVNRTGSSNATVVLKLNPTATLAATTGPSSANYAASVDAGVNSVTLTATAQDEGAVIKLNGDVIGSGVASAPIELGDGGTAINLAVTAPDGVTVKTYTVTVFRNGSSNATVAFKLTPTAKLVAVTGPYSSNYTASVAPGTASVSITPTAQEPNAVIKMNGNVIASGAATAPIALTSNSTTVRFDVTAADGVTVKTYGITITRTGSNNAFAAFRFTPAAKLVAVTGPNSSDYTTSVSPATSSVVITPTPEDEDAVVKINGTVVANGVASAPITLGAGATTINAVVTAPDGVTSRTYGFTVNRTGSSNANIAIKLTPAATLVATTGSATANYITSVEAGTTSVILTPTAQDPDAVITVNGNVVASGEASAIALNAGATTVDLSVAAPDGITVKTYSVTINRNGSNNANIALRLSPSSKLTAVTGPSNANYVTTVAASTSSVRVRATAQQPDAVIRVNGVVVASDALSAPIALGAGTTTAINLNVTAQDGVTVKTFTITVSRPASLIAASKTNRDLFYTNKSNSFAAKDEDVIVHAAVSPNGDGSNDFLVIEGLSNFTKNKLQIMNTTGNLVYEAADYGKDGSTVFDGHSNKNGALLKPGTYFYQLEYEAADKTSKRKTGYIIVKY